MKIVLNTLVGAIFMLSFLYAIIFGSVYVIDHFEKSVHFIFISGATVLGVYVLAGFLTISHAIGHDFLNEWKRRIKK